MKRIAFALPILLIPATGQAQMPPVCAPPQVLVDGLTEKAHETEIGGGTDFAGNLISVFRSADGKTWTIVLTQPGGRSCVVSLGADWTDEPQMPAPTKKPGTAS